MIRFNSISEDEESSQMSEKVLHIVYLRTINTAYIEL